MLHVVVMAGGGGTRFWPQSRRKRPKQLLALSGGETLLEQTVQRVAGWIAPERTWIVTNGSYAAATRDCLPNVPAEQIVPEPCGRNTAPCIGLAAMLVEAREPGATMLAIPADHFIRAVGAFRECVERAAQIVDRHPEALVLFGIRPTHPATGFGYIERGERLAGTESGAFRAASFREKPDRATAERYLAAGTFYWNSGIFVWKAATIRRELARCEPAIEAVLARLSPAIGSADWGARLDADFPAANSISIDHAVLERSDNVYVIEASFDWDDVGSWSALGRLRGSDAAGNAVDGPFCGLDTAGCIVSTTADHLVATVGLTDCIVVHTPDATLVARKDDEEAIRRLVGLLRERGYERFL